MFDSHKPTFLAQYPDFDEFFDGVSHYAERAGLDAAETIQWALRYARAEADSWRALEFMKAERQTPMTFEEFREGIRTSYPQLDKSRRYTKRDLDDLVTQMKELPRMTRADLGFYNRWFGTYARFLIDNNKLADREQSTVYLSGFPPTIRSQILNRLSIKKPDVLPEDGYDYADIQEAALFALSASNAAHTFSPQEVKQESREPGEMSSLIQAMSDLTKVFTANMGSRQPPPPSFPSSSQPPRQGILRTTPGGAVQNVPRWNQQYPDQYQPNCMFCSGQDHFVRECPVAAKYLVQGKVIKNDYGKLSLPDGRYPGRNIPGKNLSERVDNYYRMNGIQDERGTSSANFVEEPTTDYFETSDECVFSVDIEPTSNFARPHPWSETELDPYEQIELMQEKIDALREEAYAVQKPGKKVQFDGVEIMRRTGPPRKDGKVSPPPMRIHPNVFAREPVSLPPAQDDFQPAPKQTTPSTPNVTGKPGARAGDRSYQRPQGPMRPVDFPAKPNVDDARYRYQAAIEGSVKHTDLADRALDAKITISTRELLAASPDVRRHVKDIVTSRKVAANAVELDEADAYLTGCPSYNAPAVFLDLIKYDSFSSAATSLPLRVVFPDFGNGVHPECILDGGAQIIVMRKDVWERLRAPVNRSRATPMESANAKTTMTFGLIENHPVQLGPVRVYLQIQVVEEAPFEVLLGRPFFDITSCSEVSATGGKHVIEIKDPKTGTPYVFATEPRLSKTARLEQASDGREDGVNFRQ